jgi:hypothetical protein
MRTGLASLVFALMLLPGLPTTGAEAQTDSPGLSTPIMEIPASPVADQLVWILAQLNGGATTLTEADIRAHFAPAFLMDVLPAPILLDLLRQTAAQSAPVTFNGFAFPPTATGAVAHIDLVDPTTSEQVAIYVTIEPDPRTASPGSTSTRRLRHPPPLADASTSVGALSTSTARAAVARQSCSKAASRPTGRRCNRPWPGSPASAATTGRTLPEVAATRLHHKRRRRRSSTCERC